MGEKKRSSLSGHHVESSYTQACKIASRVVLGSRIPRHLSPHGSILRLYELFQRKPSKNQHSSITRRLHLFISVLLFILYVRFNAGTSERACKRKRKKLGTSGQRTGWQTPDLKFVLVNYICEPSLPWSSDSAECEGYTITPTHFSMIPGVFDLYF